MTTGNRLLDALVELNSKLDKLQATMDKIEVNTKVSITP